MTLSLTNHPLFLWWMKNVVLTTRVRWDEHTGSESRHQFAYRHAEKKLSMGVKTSAKRMDTNLPTHIPRERDRERGISEKRGEGKKRGRRLERGEVKESGGLDCDIISTSRVLTHVCWLSDQRSSHCTNTTYIAASHRTIQSTPWTKSLPSLGLNQCERECSAGATSLSWGNSAIYGWTETVSAAHPQKNQWCRFWCKLSVSLLHLTFF